MSYLTEVTMSDLQGLDQALDRLWSKLGIDVVFTKHFADRFNRPEHKSKPVTQKEVYDLFVKIQSKHGNKIKHLGTDMEAVMTDLSNDLNVPFVILDNPRHDRNPDAPRFQLVTKTMMKKKAFKPTGIIKKQFKVENKNLSEKKKEDKKGGNDEINLSNFDPSIYPFIKKALYRFPTAHNEIEALAKLVQALDSKVGDGAKEMGDIETDLGSNDDITMSNQRILTDILDRLESLEQTVHTEQPITTEGYGFVHEVAMNTITKGKFNDSLVLTLNAAEFAESVEEENMELIGKVASLNIEFWLCEEIEEVQIFQRGDDDSRTQKGMLSYWKTDAGYTMADMSIHESIQGYNVGFRLYTWLMKSLGWTIISDETQSEGAIKLWKKIVAHPNVVAWGEISGYSDGPMPLHYDAEDDEIEGPLDTHQPHYNDSFSKEKEDQSEKLRKAWTDGKLSDDRYHKAMAKLGTEYADDIEGEALSGDLLIYAMWGDKKTNESFSLKKAIALKELKIIKPTDTRWDIPRNKMPQVSSDDMPELVKWLEDRGVSFRNKSVDTKSLKPTQGEFQ